MRLNSIIKYRLHRYYFSSRPILPLVGVLCFMGVLYSTKPTSICSSYIVSGVFHFCLSVFVALSINGSEEVREEQLLLLHAKCNVRYYFARELSLSIISCVYGGVLILGPVITNVFNGFRSFFRPLTLCDVAMGALIILGSGFGGIAIGDMFHPRIMSDRKVAVVLTIGIMILSIVKDVIIEENRGLRFLGIMLPSVMYPSRNQGDEDYIKLAIGITFVIMMILYYLLVALIKNAVINRRKFS